MRRPIPFAMLVLLGVVLDQLTKFLLFWMVPEGRSVPVIEGVFHFTHAQNTGVAFSMLSGKTAVILGVTGLAIPIMAWWYAVSWKTGHPALLAGQGLLISGALGNLIDRVLFSYVRDFFDFVPPLPLIGKWAVFNVADIFICAGVALFLYAELFHPPKKTAEKPEAPAGESTQSP